MILRARREDAHLKKKAAETLRQLLHHTIHSSACVDRHCLDDGCDCGLKALERRAKNLITELRREDAHQEEP